ncbi:hypothetical protein PVAP13_1KG254100 [Panicum virgatum]|uniref:Terpene synthase N-terminal domain-containing protein n=1 Tax=Panicum virgatum TaxID=38727 RepID=A0A8T0X9J6_PANVG|nr:hypothetical protein PVAP13_1KG254100 [Panicum virgatum]
MEDRANRDTSSFEPSIWGDFFLTDSSPLATSAQQMSKAAEQADKVKEDVSKIVASSVAWDLHDRLQLIDDINATLTEIRTANLTDCDLQTVAMWFYLLRKHGHIVSPESEKSQDREKRANSIYILVGLATLREERVSPPGLTSQ